MKIWDNQTLTWNDHLNNLVTIHLGIIIVEFLGLKSHINHISLKAFGIKNSLSNSHLKPKVRNMTEDEIVADRALVKAVKAGQRVADRELRTSYIWGVSPNG